MFVCVFLILHIILKNWVIEYFFPYHYRTRKELPVVTFCWNVAVVTDTTENNWNLVFQLNISDNMDIKMESIFLVAIAVLTQYVSSTTTVKLIGGSETSGAVEITHDGQTGMLCDDSFASNTNGANVVCRMLGFTGAVQYTPGNKYYQHSHVRYLLDDVKCTGHESNIEECTHRSWGNSDCSDSEVAGVVCIRNNFHVELVGGDDHSGAVKMTGGYKAGFVCADTWDIESANVVCNELGFNGAIRLATGNMFVNATFSDFVFGGMRCQGNETSLTECGPMSSHINSENIYYDCVDYMVAGVECNIIRDVNLLGGNAHAGSVQVTFHNGTKRSICQDGWDLNDANVVCEMMGFDGAINIPDGSLLYSQNSTISPMSTFSCTGDEGSIQNCHYNATLDCGAAEDAAVNCCLNAPPLNITQTEHHSLDFHLNINQADIIQGDTENVTLTCDARGLSPNMSIVTLMQIRKVREDGSEYPVVEFIPGMPKPVFLNPSDARHGHIEGSLEVHNEAFLSLQIYTPIVSHSGWYRCVISYLDIDHDLREQSAERYMKVWDMPTLVHARHELNSYLDDCKSACDVSPPPAHTTTTSPPPTPPPQPQYLDLSITPDKQIIGKTPNVTILCDARGRGKDLIVVVLLQLDKVNDDGSLVPLVELLPGGQRPVFVDDSYVKRTHTAGTLDLSHGVYLEMVIPNPLSSDAGRYQCKMSFLGASHLIETATANASLEAFDLAAILQEVIRLKVELHTCRGECYCSV